MFSQGENMYKFLGLFLLMSTSCFGEDIIGTVQAKGLLFKDKISIIAFEDPSLKGIICYTTNYSRTMTLRDDSSFSSLDCKKVGTIEGELTNKNNIFSQDKGFLSFDKNTIVDRFYDSKRNVLIYLSYTKSLFEKENATHSISVIPVN